MARMRAHTFNNPMKLIDINAKTCEIVLMNLMSIPCGFKNVSTSFNITYLIVLRKYWQK